MWQPWHRNLKGRQVAVIGSGIGGLTAAISLAVRGAQVTILERNSYPGGKLSSWQEGGYRFEDGPTWLSMPQVFTRLWANAELRFSDFIELKPVEPLFRAVFADGAVVDAWQNPEQLREELSRIDAHDADRIPAFLARCEALRQRTERSILWRPAVPSRGGAKSLGDPAAWRRAMAIANARPMDDVLRRYFRNERILRLFRRYAAFAGSSPFRAPSAMLAMIGADWKHGGWYPAGGMGKLLDAYLRLAELTGVEVLTGCTVERISLRNGRVHEIEGEGFVPLEVNAVVSNADVRRTYDRFLPKIPSVARALRPLKKLPPAFSAYVLQLGVRRQWPLLRDHTIFFGPLDSREEFRQLDEWHVPAIRPTISVHHPARINPEAAPVDGSALSCQVWMPPLSRRFTWTEDTIAEERDRIVASLEQCGLTGISDHIEVERVLPPGHWKTLTDAPDGAIHGTNMNGRTAMFTRPANRSGAVRGLYFAGGTVHPGSGLSLAALGGMHAAELIADDLGDPV